MEGENGASRRPVALQKQLEVLACVVKVTVSECTGIRVLGGGWDVRH